MALELKQSLTIGDELVEWIGEFAGLRIYRAANKPDDELRLFFVKDGVAVQRLDVQAEEGGQSTAYIGNVIFTNIMEAN
jgi:hypothetical protein